MFAGMCPFGVILLIMVAPAARAAMVFKGGLIPRNLSPLSDKHQKQLLCNGFMQFHSPVQGRSPPL
jgi:hypothetical protein